MLKDDASLIIPTLVDIRTLIQCTGIQPAKPLFKRQDLCVASSQSCLIEEIAGSFPSLIVVVEFGGRVRYRLSNHGVVEAMKDVDFLMAQIAGGVDCA